MKKILPVLLVFGLLAGGCEFTQVALKAEGRVSLKNGDPSIGGQGNLCVVVTTGKSNRSEVCKELYTDSQGAYSFDIRDEISRFFLRSSQVTRAEVVLKVGSNVHSIRTVSAEQIDSDASLTSVSFVNPDGYSWGRGEEVARVKEQARAVINTSAREEVLNRYVDQYLTELNPVEITSLDESYITASGADAVLWKYSSRMTQQGRLDSRSLVILARKALSASVRDHILRLPTAP